MVIETVDEREKTSRAVLDLLREHNFHAAYADDIAEVLTSSGYEFEETLWTIWRLIDENRLFLDESGYLVVEQPERSE